MRSTRSDGQRYYKWKINRGRSVIADVRQTIRKGNHNGQEASQAQTQTKAVENQEEGPHQGHEKEELEDEA